jgi:2-polyprenyl-3-methyl-5-hydroxy-6-metoxy-1,4-benzoquinol methylase
VLDLGCGNGALTAELAAAGFEVVGCDPCEQAIVAARLGHSTLKFHQMGVYDDPLPLQGATFDAVVSTEVIEHLFLPRSLPRFAARVLNPDGCLILTTPYHGYLKNLALAVAGRWDTHLSPDWDYGHVKFWSRPTLTRLLAEEGFVVSEFLGAGRIPYLWKSMILVCHRG